MNRVEPERSCVWAPGLAQFLTSGECARNTVFLG
jgi:hypothetical protein